MGMPARHYLPLAEALAAQGVAMVVHEWRGIGSSDRRAGRGCNWGYRELLQDDLAAGLAACASAGRRRDCWIGGHSLGGQLGALYASLHPDAFAGLVLVASGSPYWRALPAWLAARPGLSRWRRCWPRCVGHLPGRRLGFAGNEARGVIADWARSGRSGRYAAHGMAEDLEQHWRRLRLPVLALRLRDDWLAPPASLDWLLGKLPQAGGTVEVIAPDDHGRRCRPITSPG